MKTTAVLSAACLAVAVLLVPASRAAEPAPAAAAAAAAATNGDARVTIPVGGMTCGGCVNNVSGKLKAVEGVKTVEVDLGKKRAVVTYDAAKVSPQALTEVIAGAGFEPGAPVFD